MHRTNRGPCGCVRVVRVHHASGDIRRQDNHVEGHWQFNGPVARRKDLKQVVDMLTPGLHG